MPPTLWLVRHAPTRDNVDGVIMGQRDSVALGDPLREAEGLLVDVAFRRVVSSDSQRAHATARAIAPYASVRLDERLRERSLGAWEGQAKSALRAAHPGVFTSGGAIRLDAAAPGFEPISALLHRVHGALADLVEGEGPVLVVAHNGSLRAALALLGLAELPAAAAMSLEHLHPIVADLEQLRAVPRAADGAPAGAKLMREARAPRARKRR
jgi:broad specificity phosphatase PhoE